MTEATIPPALKDLIDDFAFVDRSDRIDMLIEFADAYREVDPAVATRPFPEENHVTRCESQAYVFPIERPDGTLDFQFAVENPQGLSAKSFAAIMAKTLNGAPLEQVANVSPDIVFAIYGKELSMGKGQGLIGMLDHVTSAARRALRRQRAQV